MSQTKYEMRLITPQDGLPERSVLRVQEDKDGLLWYSTQSGVGTYNGYEFTNYGLPGIAPDYVWRLAFDGTNTAYTIETSGLIFRLANGEYTDITPSDLPPGGASEIAFDSLEQMWVLSKDKTTLVVLDASLNTVGKHTLWNESPDQNFDYRYKTMLTTNSNGSKVFVQSESKKVIGFNTDQSVSCVYNFDKSESEWIYNLFADDQDNLTVIFNDSRLMTQNVTGQVIREYTHLRTAPGRTPAYVTRSGKSLIYGFWHHSASSVDLTTGFEHDFLLATAGYPNISHTYHICESEPGDLWIASELGILILSPRQGVFESFDIDGDPQTSVSGNGIRSIVETDAGIFFSTDRYPFYQLDPNERRMTKRGDSACLFFNYPSFYHGTAALDGILYSVRNTSYDPLTDRTGCTALPAGQWIMAFDTAGHYYTAGTEGFNVYDAVGGIKNDHINLKRTVHNLVADDDGSIWLCTNSGVLQYQYGSGIVSALASDSSEIGFDVPVVQGLNSGIVSDVAFTSDGTMWIGTSTGLHRFGTTDNEARFIGDIDVPNLNIYSILPEGDSALWLGTGNGLVRYDIRNGGALRFVTEDGIPHNEFNRRAKLAASDGWYYMGGIDGICRFRPEIVMSTHEQKGASLTLEEVTRFDGSEVSIISGDSSLHSRGVTLGPKDRILSFTMSLADYMYPDLNEYSFQLEGLEPLWTDWQPARTVTYYNLGPGKYTFRARARSAKKVPAKNEMVIPLIVRQAFYKSTFFLVLIIALISSAIYAIVRYRYTQKLKLERLRTRIASDLHDEVGGVLSGIAMQMDLLKRDVPDSLQKRVKRVATSSRDAASKMRDVIWSVDSSRDTFEDLEERMKAVVNEMLSPIDITWTFSSTGISQGLYISSLVRQHMYLIFKEGIANIARHSAATHVVVNISPHERKGLKIVIQDNGSGFDVLKVKHGDGIRNMKSRAEKIGADLELHVDNGTEWRLSVPRVG